jgi:ankyrin repeat protein
MISETEHQMRLAADNGDVTRLQDLIRAGANPDAVGVMGDATALIHACDAGRIDVARALLDAGADIDRQSDLGDTPLTCAVAIQNVDLVRLLVERGANTNPSRRFADEKPLAVFAAELGNLEIVQILLDATPSRRPTS